YVFFQYGIPHLDPDVHGLNMEKAVMHTSLGGQGQFPGSRNVPWSDLVSKVTLDGESLAPGYAVDLADRGFASLSFDVETWPGLKELLAKNPGLLEDTEEDGKFAFRFHVMAAVT